WRFNHQGAWRWASPAEGLWTGVYFLICYWVIFNAAVFLSRHEHFRGRNRALFLSLNNGAFFALFLLTMIQVQQGGFWKFAIGYGLVLLGLAVAASRVLKPDRLSPNAYLTQGLLLLTLGFISYYTGLKLGLVLAVESVALFVLSNLLRSRIMFAGALASGGLAALWTLFSLDRGDHTDLYLGCGVSALLMVNNLVKQPQDWPSLKTNNYSRAFFAAAGSLVLFQTTWVFCPVQYRAALLALEGLLLTLSFYAFSAKEFTLTGQLFIVASQALGLTHLSTRLFWVETSQPWPWWNPLLVGAVTLFLTHWWQRQKRLSMPLRFSQFLQLIYGLTFVGLVYCGLKPHVSAPTWLMLTSALALGLTVYGIITRAWFVACAAQMFLLASSVEFLRAIGFSHGYPASGDLQSLVPIGSFLALAWYGKKVLVGRCQAPEATREGLQVITTFYLWAAFGLSLGWVFEFVPGRERFWVLNLLGAFLFLGGGLAQKRGGLLFGGCYTAVGFLVLWVQFWSESIAYWPNLLGILLLLGEQQLTKRYPARFNVPRSFQWMSIVLGAATLWLLLSKWVMLHAGGFYLTVAWGFLALLLFGTGFLLGERNYRWAGLAILGLALGRVIFFDVWKLETIYRILSFMGLGVVLLVLGFIYNKYQEKLRAWL
ncbi:MAG: Membrane protein-like protein, partial [Verrucomicrobiales bacterium]|nr:Membrane protein-like protein [Verrucomicrobiales bacterium]